MGPYFRGAAFFCHQRDLKVENIYPGNFASSRFLCQADREVFGWEKNHHAQLFFKKGEESRCF